MNTTFRAAFFLIASSGASADDFVPIIIRGDAGSVQSINTDVKCLDGNIRAPKTMFTIEPGTEVGVSANVADLVVAEVADDGVLRFAWDSRVAGGAISGGVRITMPADQLRSVVVGGRGGYNHNAQILEGFTSIDTLEVSGSTFVWASLDDVQTDLSVEAYERGTVRLKSADLKSLTAGGQARIYVELDSSVNSLDLSGQSRVFVKAPGGIQDGSLVGSSQLFASGAVSGTIDLDGTSRAYLSACTNVDVRASSRAECAERPWEGSVDVSFQPGTRKGVYSCIAEFYDILEIETVYPIGEMSQRRRAVVRGGARPR